LTFGLIRLQGSGRDAFGAASAGCGLLLCAAFAWWESRAHAPMVPLGIFRNTTFASTNVYTFFLYAALGGSLYFVPFDLQNVHGYSPVAAGAAMLPFIVIMFTFSRWSGGLVAKVGPRTPLIAGAIVAGVGFLAYARPGVGGSYWATFFPASIILGIGGALFVAPLTTAVMEALDSEQAGIASGINNAVSRVAGLLAIAALGIVLSTAFYRDFDDRIGTLNLSAASTSVLAAQRPTLGTGRPVADLLEPDRSRVNAAVADAYTAGFRRTMLLSALAAWFAAIVARFSLPSAIGAAAPGAQSAATGA
jgi:MFS family permease